jgi:hypothetical protein
VRKTKVIILALVALGIIAGSLWLVFFSDYLYIEDIYVSGVKTVDVLVLKSVVSLNLAENHWRIFPRSHIFFYRTAGLSEALQEQFTRIASVNFSPDIHRRRLNIEITERSPVGFWCASNGECALLAGDGVILEPMGRPEGIGAFVIEDASAAEFSPGTRLMAPEWILFMKEFSSALAPEILIRSYIIEPESLSAGYIRARTSADWDILLNVEFGQERHTAAVVKTLLEEEIRNRINRLEYIDLRIPGRVFYKVR